MLAIQLTEQGTTVRADLPAPKAGKGQVLIRVEACFIDPQDLQLGTATLLRIPGSGIAGRIEAVGEDVPAWRLGDRVVIDPGLPKNTENEGIAGRDRDGGLAEFVLADAFDAIPAPEGVSAVGLAAVGSAWTLAERVVSWGRVFEGETILILGAETAAGRAAVTLSAMRGAKPVTSAAELSEGEIDVISDFRPDAEVGDLEHHLKSGGIYVNHCGVLKYKGQTAVSTLGRTDIYTIEALERVLYLIERGKLALPEVSVMSLPADGHEAAALSGHAVLFPAAAQV